VEAVLALVAAVQEHQGKETTVAQDTPELALTLLVPVAAQEPQGLILQRLWQLQEETV
jgi:hypothetical protein